MDVYCIYCGVLLPEGAVFCFKCGKKNKGDIAVQKPDESVIPLDGIEELVAMNEEEHSPQTKEHVSYPSVHTPLMRHSSKLPLRSKRSSMYYFSTPPNDRASKRGPVRNNNRPRSSNEPPAIARYDNADEGEYFFEEDEDNYSYKPSRVLPPPSRRRSTQSVSPKPSQKRFLGNLSPRRTSTQVLIHNVRDAQLSDTREVATSQLELINRYHHNVLRQVQQSFYWALFTAGLGTFFIIIAISFFILKQYTSVSILSSVLGTLVYAISGVNFYIYGRASSQFSAFHVFLDRTHRFLLANSICENIHDDSKRDVVRSEIVLSIMTDASMQKKENKKGETISDAVMILDKKQKL